MYSEADTKLLWHAIGDAVGAHLSGLHDAGAIDENGFAALADGIERIDEGEPPTTGLVELVRVFDERLDVQTPRVVDGIARVGRGTLDVAATAARAVVRTRCAGCYGISLDLRHTLIGIAEANLVTLMAGTVHGVAAQPVTVASWLGGVIGPLARLDDQFDWVMETVDACPLGAGAGAGGSVEIDREEAAQRLGFRRAIDNTFDAVSAIDWIAASAGFVSALLAPVDRWLREILELMRVQSPPFSVLEVWSEVLPDLPQWHGPARIVALEATMQSAIQTADGIAAAARLTPYGPSGWALDKLLGDLLALLATATAALVDTEELAAAGLVVNRAGLAHRAGRSFVTSSDLVDFLMIEEGLEPAAAQQIATLTVSRAREEGLEAAGITPELIDGAALLVIGRELKVEFEAISRYLAPRRFVERRTALGAVSPGSTAAWLARERARLATARSAADQLERRGLQSTGRAP